MSIHEKNQKKLDELWSNLKRIKKYARSSFLRKKDDTYEFFFLCYEGDNYGMTYRKGPFYHTFLSSISVKIMMEKSYP